MISILSRQAISELVDKEPNQHVVILIANDESEIAHIVPKCKEVLCSFFDDTTNPIKPLAPSSEKIALILDWVKTRNEQDLFISCQMGISRSSAVAYLISCLKNDIHSSLDILDDKIHMPNELILKLGEEILNMNFYEPMKKFYQKVADNKKWKLEWVTKHYK